MPRHKISRQYLAKQNLSRFLMRFMLSWEKQIRREVWQMRENSRTEFKRELDDSFERAVVSFLNYPGGGEIIIGVDDNGVAVGAADADAQQLQIVDRIRNNIGPRTPGLFDVAKTQIDGKDVIRVIVSCGRQRPYYIRQFGMSELGCFIRVGTSSRPISERMMEELLSIRGQLSLQTMPSPRQNLTFRQLRIYYAEKNLEPTDQFIESLDLRLSGGEFNYAGYLLADDNGASVIVAAYAGTDKVDLVETRQYGHSCLITATQRILDRLDSENRTFAMITSKKRLERERMNTIALREIVINAIAHNDYTKGFPLVELFMDRIVVTSCGGLVEGLTEADFFKCRSMPRNRELVRVFRDVGLVERIGSGMSRILKAYDRSVFELTPSFTVVTLPFEKPFIQPNGKINGEIKKRPRSTLDVVKERPAATIPALAKLTGKSQSTISRELRKYQDAGLIHREGARKNGKWIVD
jgi:predicted HTH transcriptional regulator